MNAHPDYMLAPLFRFLDTVAHEHAELLSVLFVYVAVPVVAWLLGRRSGRKKVKQSHTFVLVIRPPAQPLTVPPVIRWEFEPPSDGSGPFGNV